MMLGARVETPAFHRPIGGLRLDPVPDVGPHALLVQQGADPLRHTQLCHVAIGEDEGLPDTEPAGVEADLVHRAQPELDRRVLHHEDSLGRQDHAPSYSLQWVAGERAAGPRPECLTV